MGPRAFCPPGAIIGDMGNIGQWHIIRKTDNCKGYGMDTIVQYDIII